MNEGRKRVAVLISGRGSNMETLADHAARPDFPAEIVAVFSDKADAGGLSAARARNIGSFAVDRAAFRSKRDHEEAMIAALERVAPDIVCLAGYMRLLSPAFVHRFAGRLINIHPSLLPLFPGLDTHQRALDAGVRIHGCSVHFVNEGMDEGAIIAQAAVPVDPHDIAETLAARVLQAEHRLYAHALALVARGTVRLGEDGRAIFTNTMSTASADMLLSPFPDTIRARNR